MTLGIILIVLLLLGNAFFVGAEFGLVSARRSSIELRALNGSWAAKVTLNAMERVSIMLAAAQLGITLCSLGLGALGEPFIAHYLEAPLHSLGVPDLLLHPISFVIALAIMTYLHVVFGEMVPKNIALAVSDRTALILVPALVGVVKVFYPVLIGLNAIANGILHLLGVQPKNEVASTFTRDEVAGFVEESHREGLISEDEEQLLSGSLRFDERTIKSVVLPLETLVTIKSTSTPVQVEQVVGKTGFSRFPVENHRGELVGYVHIKDIIEVPNERRAQKLPRSDIRPLASVSIQTSLRGALAKMQRSGAHLAVVTKSGKTVGVVTLEDVLEELVGEIRDDSQRRKPQTA